MGDFSITKAYKQSVFLSSMHWVLCVAIGSITCVVTQLSTAQERRRGWNAQRNVRTTFLWQLFLQDSINVAVVVHYKSESIQLSLSKLCVHSVNTRPISSAPVHPPRSPAGSNTFRDETRHWKARESDILIMIVSLSLGTCSAQRCLARGCWPQAHGTVWWTTPTTSCTFRCTRQSNGRFYGAGKCMSSLLPL